MLETLRNVHQLTNREIEIIRLLALGWNNRQIADKLCITVRTVKFHTTNIYEKLEVNSRPAAVVWAWKNQGSLDLYEN